MSEFVNTIDTLGDEAVLKGLIERSITEICDDVISEVCLGAFQSCASLVTAKLPNATKLNESAFKGCSSLIEVDFSSVTEQGNYVFQECSALKKVSFPSFNSTVNRSAFYGCRSLIRCDLPMAAGLDQYAFQDCSNLMELYLPESSSISGSSIYSCSKLCALILPNKSKVASLSNAFVYSSETLVKTGYIFVPSSLLETYKSATNWSAYAGRFKAIENYNALNKWDEDYTGAGYSIVHPKMVFTTATADGGTTYTFSLANAITFVAGKTYKILYDHNEYEIVATEQGIVHEAADETAFTIGQSDGATLNVVQTRAEKFSSVLGIYAMEG